MEKAQQTTGLLQTENKLMKEKTAKIPLSVDADTLTFAKHNVTRPAVIPAFNSDPRNIALFPKFVALHLVSVGF